MNFYYVDFFPMYKSFYVSGQLLFTGTNFTLQALELHFYLRVLMT